MKRFLLWIAALGLVALCIFLIIQAIYFRNLEIATQQAELGYFKEDIHMLPYGKQVAATLCWIFGVLSGMGGAALGYGLFSSRGE